MYVYLEMSYNICIGNTVKIIVELCDGDTVEPMNGMKIANGSSCQASIRVRPLCSAHKVELALFLLAIPIILPISYAHRFYLSFQNYP